LDEALGWYPSASAFVITDIARDGMLGGPDIEGLAAAAAQRPGAVIASGESRRWTTSPCSQRCRDRRHHHGQAL
jgi:hypothetical protein